MKVVQGAKFIRENAAGKLPRHAMARHTVGSNIKNRQILDGKFRSLYYFHSRSKDLNKSAAATTLQLQYLLCWQNATDEEALGLRNFVKRLYMQ